MNTNTLAIYCDESEDKGEFFGNFYGGALIDQRRVLEVENELTELKSQLGFRSELKWNKITPNLEENYIAFIEKFFDFVVADQLRIRIMFQQNDILAKNLSADQRSNKFLLLYYQFLKNAFGLKFIPPSDTGIKLHVYLDELPSSRDKIAAFKNYLSALSLQREWREVGLSLSTENISGIDSQKHNIIQGVDIVLGSMQFRLNNLHKKIPEGKHRRGKKTVSKERVYKAIRARICEIKPNFNPGVSTGINGNLENRLLARYSHWNFRPKDYQRNTQYIPKNKKPQGA